MIKIMRTTWSIVENYRAPKYLAFLTVDILYLGKKLGSGSGFFTNSCED